MKPTLTRTLTATLTTTLATTLAAAATLAVPGAAIAGEPKPATTAATAEWAGTEWAQAKLPEEHVLGKSSPVTRTMTIPVAGIDYRSPEGYAMLRGKVERASRSVCRPTSLRDLTEMRAAISCRHTALKDGMAQLDAMRDRGTSLAALKVKAR